MECGGAATRSDRSLCPPASRRPPAAAPAEGRRCVSAAAFRTPLPGRKDPAMEKRRSRRTKALWLTREEAFDLLALTIASAAAPHEAEEPALRKLGERSEEHTS